jgi:hypothetical protein
MDDLPVDVFILNMVLQGPQKHTCAQYACHRLDKVLKAALQSSLNVISDLKVHFIATHRLITKHCLPQSWLM